MKVPASVDILTWCILKLYTGWGQFVSFKLQLVCIQWKSPLLRVEQDAGWVAEPVGLLWRKKLCSMFKIFSTYICWI